PAVRLGSRRQRRGPRSPADGRRVLADRLALRVPEGEGGDQRDRLPRAPGRGPHRRRHARRPGDRFAGVHLWVDRFAGRTRRCHVARRRGAMNSVRNIPTDLVDRRLWPIALALLAALVAIPVMLGGSKASSGSASDPMANAPANTGGTSQAAISVSAPSTAPQDRP